MEEGGLIMHAAVARPRVPTKLDGARRVVAGPGSQRRMEAELQKTIIITWLPSSRSEWRASRVKPTFGSFSRIT